MSVNKRERLQQLQKQLEMYRNFNDVHGAAAVLREMQQLTKGKNELSD